MLPWSPLALVASFLLLLHLPGSPSSSLGVCPPSSTLICGESPLIDVSYPFRRSEDADHCGVTPIFCSKDRGHPGHRIVINSIEYVVKEINYEESKLRLLNSAFVGMSCPNPRMNTNLNISPFGYTDQDQQLNIYYGCISQMAGQNLHELQCPMDGGDATAYYTTNIKHSYQRECTATIRAALLRSTADELSHWSSSTSRLLGAIWEGFEVSWAHEEEGRCRKCKRSGRYCEYSSATSIEPNCIPAHRVTVPWKVKKTHMNMKKKTHMKKFMIGTFVVAGSFLLICTLMVLYFSHCWKKLCSSIFLRKKKCKKRQRIEVFLEKFASLAPKRYSYSDVEKITRCFREKLGQGGFGIVYKGKLLDDRLVAVKVLNGSKGSGKEFFTEVISIGCTYHINIVSLVGFCLEGSKRALIYEFMSNGSLDKFIYMERPRVIALLGWEKMLKIAIGVARGLEYLHSGCNIGILHFDIKPHNILLDHDLCPKISDFGLAKLCRTEDSVISMLGARGTIGYMAPEVFRRDFGGISSKSDVYSYGMMVLEMAGGKKNVDAHADNTSEIYFPHWIYKHFDEDLKPCGVTCKAEEEIARRMVMVGLWCIQTMPIERPSMSRVVAMLEGKIQDLQMPPMPVLSSPSRAYKGLTQYQLHGMDSASSS